MKQMLNRGAAATVFFISILLLASPAWAELTDLSDLPLANSPSSAVLPNLMYILDDSGSMSSDYMPNNVYSSACKYCGGTASCIAAGALCTTSSTNTVNSGNGEPPYFANEFNQIFYNPDITYDSAVTSAGISIGAQPPNAAKNDPFGVQYSGTSNLLTTYPDIYYCNISNATAAQYGDPSKCRRNGINNVQSGTNNYFLYYSNNVTAGTPLGGYPNATGASATSFIYKFPIYTGTPFYFTISPHEYCSDANLINCSLANADGTAPLGSSFPAPVRYCKLQSDAALTTVVSDTATSATPRCRAKYDPSNYPYSRYGRFRRVDIVPATATYSLRSTANRSDCANAASVSPPPYCTYAEEIQNFANWFSYYSNRLNMMKTASGQAFLAIDNRYRVGFITINPNQPVTSNKYLPLATFDAGQKSSFYSLLYSQTTNGSTPLRQALARIGRHYANVTTGINAGMPQDPMQFSCQQNFALLTSDGYWNDSDSVAIGLNNAVVGNQDNVADTSNPFFVTRKNGTLDSIGTTFSNVQPTTIVEQTLCSGSANTAFSGTAQTPCGCGVGQNRIMQRTIVQTTTVTGTDDVPNAPIVTPGTVTFNSVYGACGPTMSTVVTPVTRVEQQVITGTASTSFAAINGVAATNIAGTCSASLKRAMQRTTTWNSTVVITVGVPGAAVISNTVYVAIVPIGACAASAIAAATTTTNGTPVTTNTGTTYSTADITINPNPTVTPGVIAATTTPVARRTPWLT